MQNTSRYEGNAKLRALSPLQARSRFRAELTGHPELKDRYYRWLEDYQQIKASMGSDFRAVSHDTRRTRE